MIPTTTPTHFVSEDPPAMARPATDRLPNGARTAGSPAFFREATSTLGCSRSFEPRSGEQPQPAAPSIERARENVIHSIGPAYDELLRERATLEQKRLDEPLSTADQKRLSLIRWQLDRYELAQLEPTLEALERDNHRFEQIAASVQALIDVIGRTQPRALRRRR